MRRPYLRLSGLAALVAAIAACLLLLPVKDYFERFLESVRALGFWGPVALAAAYVPACLFFFPGSILTLGAGFLFGVVEGSIAVSLGSVAGVAAAFIAAKTLARGLIEGRIASNPKFRAVDQAVAEQGFKIVLLMRLSPVFPFNALNFAFGLTRVRFRDYLLASWIGMFPGTLLYVSLGSAVQNLGDLVSGKVEGGLGQKALFFAGLAAAAAVTIFVTRIARRALANAVPATQSLLH
jgi:uncharacterized membrane protein YdjX (TVP38/TMEM64 family)